MAGDGYQVHTDELRKYADYLKGTTAPAVSEAASGVHSANGFQNNAFGVFLAQVLAVPARIAMGVVAGNLSGLSKEVGDFAGRTTQAATVYDDREDKVAGDLGAYKGELA